MNNPIQIGVIGCGYWGPNHVRVFSQLKECRVVGMADSKPDRVTSVIERFPHLHGYLDYRDLLRQPDLDAVVVATPTRSHAAVVETALKAGKHVLCEKPLCVEPAEGDALVSLARSRGLMLMVGHVFLFNAGIVKVKQLIDAGEIGEVRYLAGVRTNLGPVRSDVNAAFDLASHDIATFNWLLDAEPIEVRAMGAAFVQPGIEDVVVITLKYPANVLASIQCSWLDPRKVRLMTVVGSQKMITWDDLALANPVAIYEKSVTAEPEVTDYAEFLKLSIVDGDVRLPRVTAEEPLKAQALSFLRFIAQGRVDRAGGEFGVGVVRVLKKIEQSLGAEDIHAPGAKPSRHAQPSLRIPA
jgi:predicted dehydrogenase